MQRTILDIVSLLKESVECNETACAEGLLQRCDPRCKLLFTVLMLFCVLASKSIMALCVLYFVTLIFVALSSENILRFLKRTLFFIPVFSLFIVLPSVFDFVTPGEAVLSFVLFGWHLTVTRQGLASAGILLMRVLDSVSLCALLMLTTRHHALLKTLRMFKVPQLFIMILAMTWRYIYLLLDIVQKSFLAIKSRVGYVTSAKNGRRVIGANLGFLWLKSYRLQTQVYDAMLSRGYTGEPKILDDFHMRVVDGMLLASSIFFLAGTVCLNHYIH